MRETMMSETMMSGALVGEGGGKAEACRLCGGATRTAFTGQVLRKYPCRYLLCAACGSLQTEPPHWLAEAYRDGHLVQSDTGVVWRCTQALGIVYLAARLLGLPRRARVLDFGGGSGLLCRMLRDIGFDARVSDRHAGNELARGFDDPGPAHSGPDDPGSAEAGFAPDMVCAFEVAEHFAAPRTDMAGILGRGAAVCVVGTLTYRGEGSDWWYLNPLEGQHVFFYSPAGMQVLAARHGYLYERVTNLHFFLRRPLGRVQSALFWRGMTPAAQRLVRTWLALRQNARFTDADQRAMLARVRAEPASPAGP